MGASGFVGAALALAGMASAGDGIAHPPNPFADEFLPPRGDSIGVAEGQLRSLGSAGVIGSPTGLAGLTLSGTLELVAQAHLGVRLTSEVAPIQSAAVTRFLRLGTGPSLHLFPTHRVDLAFYVEGGLALVEGSASRFLLAPALTPGLDLEVALTGDISFFVQGQWEWCSASQVTVHSPEALVGLGFVI